MGRAGDRSGIDASVETRNRRHGRVAAALSVFALTACTPERVPTETLLVERGVAQPVVSAEPWLFGPCAWSELYTAHFAGRYGGRVVTGTLCAASEDLSDARLRDLREVWPRRGQP